MKFGKKLLIATLSATLLTPTATANTQKPYAEMILLADENTQPSDHKNTEKDIIYPNSINIIKVI